MRSLQGLFFATCGQLACVAQVQNLRLTNLPDHLLSKWGAIFRFRSCFLRHGRLSTPIILVRRLVLPPPRCLQVRRMLKHLKLNAGSKLLKTIRRVIRRESTLLTMEGSSSKTASSASPNCPVTSSASRTCKNG